MLDVKVAMDANTPMEMRTDNMKLAEQNKMANREFGFQMTENVDGKSKMMGLPEHPRKEG